MRPTVYGLDLDPESRCAHWHGPLDIIAIKMRCCGAYYACRECHDVLADHPAKVWPQTAWREVAVLCGACGRELTVAEYLACDNRCPACLAAFNPGCRKHKHLYFATEAA
jgi:uncharacterized CHY-type Zn-finger protein